MYSTLIVARMNPASAGAVAGLFEKFDESEMPRSMGTIRRQLFSYQGLYFHLQDFATEDGERRIDEVRTHPLFTGISADLRSYIDAYDPATWRSPADATARRFYHWSAESAGNNLVPASPKENVR